MSKEEIPYLREEMDRLGAVTNFRTEVTQEDISQMAEFRRAGRSRLASAALTFQSVAQFDLVLSVRDTPFLPDSDDFSFRKIFLIEKYAYFSTVADIVLEAEEIIRTGAPLPSEQRINPDDKTIMLFIEAMSIGGKDYNTAEYALDQAAATLEAARVAESMRRLPPEEVIRKYANDMRDQSPPPFDILVEKGAQRFFDLYSNCP